MKKGFKRSLLLSFLLLLLAGCGGVVTGPIVYFDQAVPRVEVNGLATIKLFLSKQYTEDEELEVEVTFSDGEVARMAEGSSTLKITKGMEWLTFNIQGLKAGATIIYARIKGRRDDERAKTEVSVLPN